MTSDFVTKAGGQGVLTGAAARYPARKELRFASLAGWECRGTLLRECPPGRLRQLPRGTFAEPGTAWQRTAPPRSQAASHPSKRPQKSPGIARASHLHRPLVNGREANFSGTALPRSSRSAPSRLTSRLESPWSRRQSSRRRPLAGATQRCSPARGRRTRALAPC